MSNVELAKPRDFGEIINDTFIFVRQNFKPLLKYFFIFCGFFLLATTATSILNQINMIRRVNNFNPNSFDADNRFGPFLVFTPTYFLAMFFVILEYVSISVVVLSFMALYKVKQNQVPDTEEMWGYFKFYFLKALGSSFVIGLLVIVGSIFCLIPGIYLYPVMSLVLPIMIIENTSFGYAFNHSFRLIKDNWWSTFGVLVVVIIILSVASMIVTIPSAIIGAGSIFLHFTKGTTISVTAVIITTILQQFIHVLNILIIVATCLCYFNLTESKEGTSMLERINKFGTANPESDVTPEQY
ncbi:hypothetical protein ACPPVU_23205 [Mucilaginibacter sp. McL0603]|uniref:hypothetical protein n=1 Tax=Mucilaginibacter sp. McL0603 TaxID=3415670 RepID=UPI003CF30DA1